MCLAVPGKIEEITGTEPILRTGKVNFNGIVKTIHLGYVPEAKVGDYVNVHAGFAIAVLNEDEATEIWSILNEMSQQKK
ncbi:HypC/HybG/HupF family hydrogenase formation chaperone [candidate division KSB1 bacterium]|nr:HypC/HybG/HupF family hydrogenase formation chaperone [candidate division KSB1 bacterium]